MFQAHIYSNNHVMEDCMQAISHIQQEFSVTSCASVAKAFSHRSRKFSNSSLSAKVSASERTLHAALEADVTRLNKIVEKSELDLTDISELLGTLEMRLEAISRYQSLHGSEGHRTLLFIVLPKLAELTKKYLVMENTASRSEQRLHSLTSRDGDWFLDELAWVNDNLLEYIRMTTHHPPQSDTPDDSGSDDGQQMMCSPVLCNIVAGVKEVYASLQDLVLNFQQIILPDVLTSLVKEDAEVLRVVDSLDKEILKGHDLDTLGSKLENMLRNIIFGTKVIDSKTFDEVRELRGAFSRLCLPADTCSPMTKGAMVTKAFSGLFDRVFEEYSAVMLNLDKLQIPKSWRKVDVIREAGALQLTQFNDKTKNILADLFFIKQLAAMAQFFSIAKRYASIFIVVEPIAVESYDALSKPIKSFVADFVRKQILGVASQSAGYFVCEHLSDIGLDVEKEIALKDFGATSRVSIDDLCKKGLDKRTQTGTQLSQANTLISNFETAWKRQDVAKRLIRSRGLMEALISQQTKYLTCYQWLHEDLLPAASTQGDVNQPTRKELLTQLRSSLSVMVQSNSSYIELSEKVSAAEGQITQRLKWNAGANPKLASVLTRFEAAQAARSSLLQTQTNFMKELSTYSHSVLHLETMRSNSQDAVNLESKCNQLISRCLDVCKNLEGDSQINEQQRLMMSLMSKGDRQKTGNAFLGRAHDSVQSHSSSLMSKIKGLKRSVGVIQEKYQSHVSTMQFVTLNAHHKLISEVRAVLKTLAKEEMDDGGNLGCWVQQYLKDYKVFSEQLAKVIKLASNESLKDQLSANIETLLAEVQQDVESIFTRLIDIAKPLAVTTANNEKDKTDKPTTDDLAAGQELDISTSTSASANKDVQNHAEKIPRDPKTGKVVQERNSYAVSVWRRVKMKLDGRELDPSKKMSVTDQVSYIINEASDIKNLAQMYEGWTSWV
ncbi:SMG1 [Bugula neritina]|nr:SMG1 [Bugula neritina]